MPGAMLPLSEPLGKGWGLSSRAEPRGRGRSGWGRRTDVRCGARGSDPEHPLRDAPLIAWTNPTSPTLPSPRWCGSLGAETWTLWLRPMEQPGVGWGPAIPWGGPQTHLPAPSRKPRVPIGCQRGSCLDHALPQKVPVTSWPAAGLPLLPPECPHELWHRSRPGKVGLLSASDWPPPASFGARLVALSLHPSTWKWVP